MVLQRDLDDRLALLILVLLVGLNVALLVEYSGDLELHFRCGSFNHLVVGFHRVPNSRQEIRNWISHCNKIILVNTGLQSVMHKLPGLRVIALLPRLKTKALFTEQRGRGHPLRGCP